MMLPARQATEATDTTAVVAAGAPQPQSDGVSQAGAILDLQRRIGNRSVARLLSRWPAIEDLAAADGGEGSPYDQFVAKIWSLHRHHRRPTDADLMELTRLRDLVALDRDPSALRRLEHVALLWPKQFGWMDAIIGLVTGADRRSAQAGEQHDRWESRQGRFESQEGLAIASDLIADRAGFKGNKCLNYLYQSGLTRLFGGQQDEVAEVKRRYRTGARERANYTSRGSSTLSRLAAELGIQGLVGPVHLLKWRRGRYEPSPSELFDRLSSAGDGWYFFLVSAGSYHTLIIAVEVTGLVRTYYILQSGSADSVEPSYLDDEYFPFYARKYGVSSRVWQIYNVQSAATNDDRDAARAMDAPTPSPF